MTKRGHTVYHYGHEDSIVNCTEHINVINNDILKKSYGNLNDWKTKGFDQNVGTEAVKIFNNNCIIELNKRIKQLGLSWIKEKNKKMSRGQTALTLVMKKLLPGEEIVNEHHLGDKLRLDVYCPKYNLAAEYHGRQHFFYTQRFFDTIYEFEEAQKRDVKKMQMCKDLGIALIVFRYNDNLSEESVYDRMLQAIKNAPDMPARVEKRTLKNNQFYLEAKKKNSESRKDYYKKMKEKRKKDGI